MCISSNIFRAESSSLSGCSAWYPLDAENDSRTMTIRRAQSYRKSWGSGFNRTSSVEPAIALNPDLSTSTCGPLPCLSFWGPYSLLMFEDRLIFFCKANLESTSMPFSQLINWFFCLFSPPHRPRPLPGVFTRSIQKDHLPPALSAVQLHLSTPINRLHSIWQAFALKTFLCQSLPPH